MNHSAHKSRRGEQGYILLTLLLFVALLTIAAISIAPTIEFQVRRDREEELIHRGTQYSRAIQHYYKKFNRYPSKIEDLESSNNLHFLRKRYKDPITGEDFKLVHFGEGQLPNAVTNAGASGPPGAKGSNSGFGSSATSNSSSSPASSTDATDATGASPSSSSTDQSAPSGSASSNGSQAVGGGSSATTGFGSSGNSSASTGKDKLAGKTFGGGPIIGVVSTSKAESIREFAKKNHYNDWQFVYDPNADSGSFLSVPNQTGTQAAGMQGAPGVRGNQGVLGGMGPGNMGGAGNTGFGNSGSGNSGPGNSGSPFGAPSQQPQR